MRKGLFTIFFSVLLLAISGCAERTDRQEVELTISAAASLQDALEQIAAMYKKEQPNVALNFNYGASGALQQQIIQGAPVDMFFSASKAPFEVLIANGTIEQSIDLLHNELVLITANEERAVVKGMQDLVRADVGKIAIGTPEVVPAGDYAKEYLENMNLWSQLEPKLVFAKDVRQVLTYVETENVEAGFVYKTDALTSKKVKIVEQASTSAHSAITYPLGIIKNSKQQQEAQTFYEFLQKENILQVFVDYGFTIE